MPPYKWGSISSSTYTQETTRRASFFIAHFNNSNVAKPGETGILLVTKSIRTEWDAGRVELNWPPSPIILLTSLTSSMFLTYKYISYI